MALPASPSGFIRRDDGQSPDAGLPAAEILLANDGESAVIDGVALTSTADGGAVVDFAGAQVAPSAAPLAWDANLAEHIDEAVLDRIAGELEEAVIADIASRSAWEKTYLRGIDSLGLTVENRDNIFVGACGARDPLMAEAAIRFQATYRGELLAAGGPVKTTIVGSETPESRDQAERVKTFLNYYLTQLDKGYYADSDQMGMWLAIGGSTFKKIYQSPATGLPISRYILPDKLIVAYTTSDLASCPRMTHVEKISKRQLVERQLNGTYRTITLPEPSEAGTQTPTDQKIDKTQGTAQIIARGDDRYETAECHADYALPGYEHADALGPTGLPLPWLITYERATQKILAIRRNWREGDQTTRRRQYFVPFRFLPGFGVYGFGLAHILGGYEAAATSLLRQLVDAGQFANFPGGVRAKGGAKVEDPNHVIGPGEFVEIDTGGLPLRESFQPLPYKEVSVGLVELRQQIVESARRVAATTDIAVGDGRQDAPVGTTVALLEAATKIESAVIKRCYASQGEELVLLAELFGEVLPDEGYPFLMPGGETAIMRQDFDKRIDVIPVGDPNIPSSAARQLRAEGVFRTAAATPDIHDMREVNRYQYESWGIPRAQIDKFLPPPAQAQPMDPVSENQVALRGGPLAVGEWQDDDAHIAVHMGMAEMLPPLMAHIAEHFGSKFRKVVQMVIGMPLPSLGQQMPPEVENQIARMTAESMQAIKEATGMMPGAEGQDMMAVAMEDIRVKREGVQKKFEEGMASIRQRSMDSYLDHVDRVGGNQVKLRIAAMQVAAGKEQAALQAKTAVKVASNRSAAKPAAKGA